MPNLSTTSGTGPRRPAPAGGFASQISPEHYLQLIWHRKWLVLGTFLLVSTITFVITYRMPDVFQSETLILVDPQKVPESYVKATVTGDVRNRLGTLSQQILSSTRLQKIIDSLNLYPELRKKAAREDVISLMRREISVSVVSDFGGSQDLQAFRISYSGSEPRLVAQVANELATLFIDENLKVREQQATGTTEFLQNQMQETRKILETQESKLSAFKMKHLGEMPEQQTANLQILGQLQSQLQIEGEALNRAEQNKTMLQAMMIQAGSAPVMDLGETESKSLTPETTPGGAPAPGRTVSPLDTLKSRLAALQARYGDTHPEVRKVKALIQDEEARAGKQPQTVAAAPVPDPEVPAIATPPAPVVAKRRPVTTESYSNPVVSSQIKSLDAEIAKHKEQQLRLNKQVAGYQSKVEAIPLREQEITELVRDYETNKVHYQQLLDKQLSAETATQLEIRQKGEKFSVLDPAQPAERPARPNRRLINSAGSLAGLGLGLLLALMTEFLGMSITAPEQLTEALGIPVLEVIPVIQTYTDRRVRKKHLVWAAVSCVLVTIVVSCAFLVYRYRT